MPMRRRVFISGVAAAIALPVNVRAADLASMLRYTVSAMPATVGIYARAMNGGPPIFTHNSTESFPAASTIKMLILLTAFRAQERDPDTMQSPVRIRRSDLVGGSPFLASARGGEQFTVAQLVRPMIQLSDNSASNALISHFGFEMINAVAQEAGLAQSHLRRHFLDYSAIVHHHENVTTPRDMGTLFYKIEQGAREGMDTVASASSCRAMVEILLGQTDRDKIPAGLPRGVPVANKTGEVDGVRNDVAIVDPFGTAPYVLAVLTKNVANYSDALRGINRISRDIYDDVRVLEE